MIFNTYVKNNVAGMYTINNMSVQPLLIVYFFPWGIPQLQSDWSLSCDGGLDYAS